MFLINILNSFKNQKSSIKMIPYLLQSKIFNHQSSIKYFMPSVFIDPLVNNWGSLGLFPFEDQK